MLEPENGTAEITRSPTQARQGVTSHNVRYVLIFSLLGVIAAFGLVAWHYS